MPNSKEIYLQQILEQMPRILGLLNRNPSSPTYGCFDRNYWQYKIVDFPTARAQEAVLTLAILYKLKHPKNPFYKKKAMLEWVKAAVRFWMKSQSSHGSFEEWYPHENSYVATAFSLYAVSEVYKILKNELKGINIAPALERSALWLCKRKETRVMNQETGALVAVYNVYQITKNTYLKQKANEKARSIIENQNKEGWFNEYGGPDIGYLSLAISYLSKYHRQSKDSRIKPALKKAIEFISYFMHPDFTAGGSYGSRQTEYLMPHGFELSASWSKDAESISNFIRNAIKKKSTITPASLDDRYLLQLSYDYLQAYMDGKMSARSLPLPGKKSFTKVFPNADLIIFSNRRFYLVINTKKTSFKATWKNKAKSLDDSGIETVDENGNALTSNNNLQINDVSLQDHSVTMHGSFNIIHDSPLTGTKAIAMRGFQKTIGRSQVIGQFVKEKLRDITISKSAKSDVMFVRKIAMGKESIKIDDRAVGRVKRMLVNAKSSYLFVPSSKYFQYNDIKQDMEVSKKPFITRVLK